MSLWPRKKIIVPVDLSDASLDALRQALAMVDDPSHVQVINVIDVSADDVTLVYAISRQIKEGEKRLTEWMTDKFKHIKSVVLVGNPGYQITDYAREIGADLIVLPSHGRTGIKRLLLGSVAERVVRLAHCPVLVLRMQTE